MSSVLLRNQSGVGVVSLVLRTLIVKRECAGLKGCSEDRRIREFQLSRESHDCASNTQEVGHILCVIVFIIC